MPVGIIKTPPGCINVRVQEGVLPQLDKYLVYQWSKGITLAKGVPFDKADTVLGFFWKTYTQVKHKPNPDMLSTWYVFKDFWKAWAFYQELRTKLCSTKLP